MATLAIAFFSLAPFASAHERDTFKIGDKYYLLTVGSLNEPFVVDNISGVDLRVSQVAGPGGNGASKETGKGTPVTGLEQTLKVELAAGDKKETLSLRPFGQSSGRLRRELSFRRCKRPTAIAFSGQSTAAPLTSLLLAFPAKFRKQPKIIPS